MSDAFLGKPNIKIIQWLRRSTYSISIDVDLTKGYVIAPTSTRRFDTIELKAVPNEGYQFDGWSDGNEDATRRITAVDDINLTAYFKDISKIQLIAIPDDPAHGTVTGSGQYNYGTFVVLRAFPVEGWNFIKWNDRSAENPRTVVALEDKTYIAEFEDNFGTITYKENY